MLEMNNLFDIARAEEVKARVNRLQPTTQRQWGRMTAPQALAHCAVSMEATTSR
jgi:hypothetical protein